MHVCIQTEDCNRDEYFSAIHLPKAIDNPSEVVDKGAWYAIGIDPYTFTPSMVSVGVKERWSRPSRDYIEPPTQKGWSINYFESRPYSNKFRVLMTPRTSVEDWQRYTAFNYSCFWKYKGCRDARDLLPTADPFPYDK
jgi:hypothetical protein